MALECLEDRSLLATFVVTSTADSGPGTLREAILGTNAAPGADRIEFAIPTSDPGYSPPAGSIPEFWSIQPKSALPTIARDPGTPTVPNPVVIDATTQPGFAGRPVVEINGINAGAGVDGLKIAAGDSTVRGLIINQFQFVVLDGSRTGGAGIHIVVNGNNQIVGNFLGPDVSAARRVGNTGAGLFIENSPGNTVGGAAPEDGNVLSSNQTDGLFIQGPLATGNIVRGNAIGTNFLYTPSTELANLIDGVEIDGAPGNTVGGTGPGEGNVIARNNGNGVSIRRNTATGNVVLGNFIGTDPFGGMLLGNLLDGVFLEGAVANTIGGSAPGAGNVVGRNRIGIDIQPFTRDSGAIPGDSTDNVVQGNLVGIGLNADGATVRLDNLTDGINIGGSRNTIGGADPNAANIISRNGSNGIQIVGRDLGRPDRYGVANVVIGNRIGTDPSGTVDFGNAQAGIVVSSSAANQIGPGNLVSGNDTSGITIQGTFATGNLVIGNRVGTDATGTVALGNGTDGVVLTQEASGNRIGGPTAVAVNILSANGVSGIRAALGAHDNQIWNNSIGLDVTGTAGLGNGVYGILMGEGAVSNTVGGAAAFLGNRISSNRFGILITGPAGGANPILGNTIGLLANEQQQSGVVLDNTAGNQIGGADAGAANRFLGNTLQSLVITGVNATGNRVQGNLFANAPGDALIVANAPGNQIGGAGAGEGNEIINNRGTGVLIAGQQAIGNLVQGNRIGATSGGTVVAGNRLFGIRIQDASGNTIGGGSPGQGNVVAGNRIGVQIEGPDSVGNALLGNYIGTNAAGMAGLGNTGDGVLVIDAIGTIVGGASAALGNVISGNALAGLHLLRATSTSIRGNRIGTDPSGTRGLGNLAGIQVEQSSGGQIGEAIAGAGNTLSGNQAAGLEILGNGTSSANQIVGNRIGTDISGQFAIPNDVGISLEGAAGQVIRSNQIAGNANFGVRIQGTNASGNAFLDNQIGLAIDGLTALANGTGVMIDDVPGNTIGPGNVISGNLTAGITIQNPGATGNRIFGNRIGTDAAGRAATGRVQQSLGILIDDAPGNTVGGTDAASTNLISGNVIGVEIAGFNAATSGLVNVVQGNRIGTDLTGTKSVGNRVGVFVNGTPGGLIGGTTPGAGNLISGNTSIGVELFGVQTTRVDVQGNLIGTAINGRSAIASGRVFVQQVGVYIENSPSNRIGGPAGAGNTISGNGTAGVYIFGQSGAARANLVQGNRIGLAASGASGPGNGQYGVLLFNSPENTVTQNGPLRNRFGRNGIANFREFTGPVVRGNASASSSTVGTFATPGRRPGPARLLSRNRPSK